MINATEATEDNDFVDENGEDEDKRKKRKIEASVVRGGGAGLHQHIAFVDECDETDGQGKSMSFSEGGRG